MSAIDVPRALAAVRRDLESALRGVDSLTDNLDKPAGAVEAASDTEGAYEDRLRATLARNVKAMREARGESQAVTAAGIGRDRTWYSKIESGTQNITIDALSGLCKHFHVSAPDLLSD